MRLNPLLRNFIAGAMMLGLAGMITSAPAGDCTIHFDSLLQRMSGFGGSTAWAGGLADNLINGLFSPTDGCGLNLVRMRIAPNGTTGSGEITIAKKAQALGASIWAAPWSPPAEWKDNNNVNNGGNLRPENYQNWADRLVTYVKNLSTQGVDLKWISAQNEPNWTADYESCRYTAAQIVTFIAEYLGPSLEKAGLKTRIIAPEVINWGSLKPYGDAILNNTNALKYCDVIASHSYGDEPRSPNFPYKLVLEKGKELWETEYGFDQFAGDESMVPGIAIAKQMHGQIVNGPVSAYHTWWIIPADGVNGTASNGLVMRGKIIQRGYVMGNYSRFVRPGSRRVAANHNPTSGIWVTAYKNDSLGRLVVVAINESSSAVQQNFLLSGVTVPNVTPWETSDAVKLTARAQITAGTGFSWSLPAKSVVSFVGSYSVGTGRNDRGTIADKKPARKITFDMNSFTAIIPEKGDFTLAIYTLQGSLIGSYAGRGPGRCRIPFGRLTSGTYLVAVSKAGRRASGELVVLSLP
jgi:glucuronoarabinoxylan endo-1,4-beta-xylanase